MKSDSVRLPPIFPPAIGVRLPSALPGVECYELIDAGRGKGAQLGEGRRGIAYLARVNGGDDNGDRRVIKFPKIDLTEYTLEKTKRRVEEIHEGQLSELRVSWELKEVEDVTPILESHGGPWRLNTDDGPWINLFHTVYWFIEGESLPRWCRRMYPADGGVFSGLREADHWFTLSRRLLAKLDEVHCRRVVHADIWPDNIMIRPDGRPVLIDFGEAWSMSYQLDSMLSRVRGHEYLAPERCGVATEAGRWSSAADIYSMGGVLFYLATGQAPPSPFRLGTQSHHRGRDLKIIIQQEIKARNRVLYEQQPGVVDVILMCMRPEVADRARHAGEVIETIDTLCGGGQMNGLQAVIDEVAGLNRTLRELQAEPLAQNPIIQRVVLRSIRSLHHDAQTLRSRVYSIDGTRESFVNGLLACVGTLGPGDELRAVTSTRFWRKQNFGMYGRLTSMLIAAATRGADIDWQLLIDPEFESDDQQVLAYQ